MTRYGRYFSAVALVLWCISLALSIKTLYYPALLMLLLVVGSAFLIWMNGRSIYTMFFTGTRKLTRGESVVVEYMLTNRSILPIFFLDVQIEFAKEMGLSEAVEPESLKNSNRQLFFAPFRIMTFKRAAICQYRGFYKVGNMSVVLRDPMGFFEKTLRFEKAVKIAVFPKVHLIRADLMHPLDTDGLLQTRNQFHEDRTSIRNIRAYEDDAVQHIHWKVSARLGKPYVKNYQVSAEDTLILMVNGAQQDYQIEGVNLSLLDEQTVEWAVSYGQFYMAQGFKVHLVFCGKNRVEVGLSGIGGMALMLEEATAYELAPHLNFEQTIESEISKRFAGTRLVLLTPDPKRYYAQMVQRLGDKKFHIQLVNTLERDVMGQG